MTWPRQPRRLCRQCQTKPCRKAEQVFCSEACYRASRRPVRPFCRICGVKRVCKQSRNGTCGRVCGSVARWHRDAPQERARLSEMWRRGRSAFLARLVGRLREDVDRLHQAQTDGERAEVLARIYRLGYKNGSSNAYYRYVTAARRRA